MFPEVFAPNWVENNLKTFCTNLDCKNKTKNNFSKAIFSYSLTVKITNVDKKLSLFDLQSYTFDKTYVSDDQVLLSIVNYQAFNFKAK